MKTNVLAFDRASVRSFDHDGRLHVEVTNISKANVCPYHGSEIPDADGLGLDPDRVYYLLRDPDELKKAAPSFNNLPLLSTHLPATAEDHPTEHVVGSTGPNAEFVAPFLRNSLVIWPAEMIKAIEAGEQKELSCGYRYRPDMTPGTYQGEKYDGVMRDIVGNHIALVATGRAGPECVVGDAAFIPSTKDVPMSKVTRPKTAGGKIAKDANLDDLVELLKPDGEGAPAEGGEANADPDLEPIAPEGESGPVEEPVKGNDIDALAKVKEFLAGKISDEDMSQVEALMSAPATDADPVDPPAPAQPEAAKPDEDKKPPFAAADADADEDKDTDMVSKPAMDAAIAAAEKRAHDSALKTAREIRDAERAVRPLVGELAHAFDSAAGVYGAALKVLGVDTKGVHPSAFPAMLKLASDKKAAPKPVLGAMDAAASKEFAERFPHADRLV